MILKSNNRCKPLDHRTKMMLFRKVVSRKSKVGPCPPNVSEMWDFLPVNDGNRHMLQNLKNHFSLTLFNLLTNMGYMGNKYLKFS